ncbi:MAG TPA: hypothetical protein VHQ86_05840, partial [Candidatus Saccharimonadia bacterium]|nr:hypothetical protein [Candidatus Saccharimonadia bacterium]
PTICAPHAPKPVAADPTDKNFGGDKYLTVTLTHNCGDVAWSVVATNIGESSRSVGIVTNGTFDAPGPLASHATVTVTVKKSDSSTTNVIVKDKGNGFVLISAEEPNC